MQTDELYARLREETVATEDRAAPGFTALPDEDGDPAADADRGEEKAEVLLIVPPFASIWYPSLGVHVLQACARAENIGVDVLYANLLLASLITEEAYEKVAAESISMAAERFFARAAFGLPPLGHGAERAFDPARIYGEEQARTCEGLYPDAEAASMGLVKQFTIEQFRALEAYAGPWVDAVARQIVAHGYRIVGATTTFQQTTASIALLAKIKELDPRIVTILGGANCEGEMADGLLGLGSPVDYIFSGESEDTFPPFAARVLRGERPEERIIRGRPCENMDGLPMLSSDEFFTQREAYLPDSTSARSTLLSFETSRGCWWGQKQHCTFCGLNGEGMAFRQKTPDRVLRELKHMLRTSPTRNISMADNIMPHDYFRTLVPRLSSELPGVSIFYEQKANLTLQDMLAFKEAGIKIIQPGIEAISTGLLKLMRKGVNARQNLMLLRYGRVTGIQIVWNLICGFPNDKLSYYEETAQLVPLIMHLQPPNGMFQLSIERFSPYFTQPEVHGVRNIRALPVYRDFLPENADIEKIAYHFVGDYVSDTHRFIGFVRDLNVRVQEWLAAWERPYPDRPELKICRDGGRYFLFDSRGLPDTTPLRLLSREEARTLASAHLFRGAAEDRAAVAAKLAVVVDNWFVPLPVAQQQLFCELSDEHHLTADESDAQLIQLTSPGHRPPPSRRAGSDPEIL